MTEQNIIEGQQFDAERALYKLNCTVVKNCVFIGPADGESPLKETRGVSVYDTAFSLRYAFWHALDFGMYSSKMDELCRAPLWYCRNGVIEDSVLNCIKALRDCREIKLTRCEISSPEFGWKSKDITLCDSQIESEYLFFDASDVRLENVRMKGKYSFQYMDNLTIENSVLDTKDAFWHSNNVLVRNSVVKGEYLGWYSNGLTLENCEIQGTQPLCHCTNLRLINCTMTDCDLAFEDSEVDADIKGEVDSIMRPNSGQIVCDGTKSITGEGDGQVIVR